MNFLALGIPIDQTIELAFEQEDTKILAVGERLFIYPWSTVLQDYRDGKMAREQALDLWFDDDLDWFDDDSEPCRDEQASAAAA